MSLELKLALLEFCEAVAGVEGVKPSPIMTDADITLRVKRATDRARALNKGEFIAESYETDMDGQLRGPRSAAGHAGGGHGE